MMLHISLLRLSRPRSSRVSGFLGGALFFVEVHPSKWRLDRSIYSGICIYVYVYLSIYINLSLSIYIYRERERVRMCTNRSRSSARRFLPNALY